MIKLNWHEPDFIPQRNFSFSCDDSMVNMYLLRKKHKIEVAESDEILFRHYNSSKITRRGYGFPLSDKNFDLEAAIEILKEDSVSRGENLRFCLCTEEQRTKIDKILAVNWYFFDGDSDYVYKREDFTRYSGNKRTLFNRFMRNYPDAKYFPLTTENLHDALTIAENWLSEKFNGDISLKLELESIRETASNWQNLGMKGSILYANGEPAVFIMFSALNDQCIDIHFMKSTSKFAKKGANPALYRFLASWSGVSNYEYVNVEYDLGIEGLRRSKESYRPCFMVKKYYGDAV